MLRLWRPTLGASIVNKQVVTMLPIFFATYSAVFVAEIVGDKLLYTTGVLAARYRTVPIMIGMAVAFMAKMGVAVMGGKPEERGDESRKDHAASKAAMISFAAIFFSEWGDLGQVTAATMAARFG